jgi:5-oxoprolinase (ATP-hydrolysing)
VTDVVLKAFQACAASQGDCNNLTFGFGGNQSGSDEVRGFGYYETIAGGSGAGPTWKGSSGVHTHMTNTRITDAEVFERRYPVLLREFGLRRGSGGKGRHNGGDGVVRDIEFRIPVTVSILSERRVYHPYGLEGGEEGQCGLNTWVRKVKKPDANADATLTETPNEKAESKKSDGLEDAGGEEVQYRHINMGGKNTAEMKAGERIIVMTPGGGAWGKEGDESAVKEKKDPKHAWRGGSVASRQGTAESSA